MYRILHIVARLGARPSADPTKDPQREFDLRVVSYLTPGQEQTAARDFIKQQLGDNWRVANVRG